MNPINALKRTRRAVLMALAIVIGGPAGATTIGASGENTITGNFKKAPWVVTAGAGDTRGNLAGFSSRGKRDSGGQVEVDGETFTWVDRPNVVAPGVDVVSAQAKSDPLALPEEDAEFFDSTKSGTSMAAPHTSGVVALMLEADPTLHWSDVIRIPETTATNMPGRQPFEVKPGYINAHAAVAAAAGERDDYGQTQTLGREFFDPALDVTRASYAFSAVNWLDRFRRAE